jgi:hypothetical protein
MLNQTLCIVKEGCRYLNPSNGAREQLVTNFRSKQRSVGFNPLMTCRMHKEVRTILTIIYLLLVNENSYLTKFG